MSALASFSHQLLTRHSFWIGLIIRFVLAWLLPLFMDGGSVPYTDIDYHVFMDAAAHVQRGQSPYQRTTYRYTPFLAQLLAWLSTALFGGSRESGRYLFCLADACCGFMIARYRQEQRIRKQRQEQQLSSQKQQQQQQKQQDEDHNQNESKWFLSNDQNNENNNAQLYDALWWLYNPLAINICTRGSAESFMVLFPVLVTMWLVQWWCNDDNDGISFRFGGGGGGGILGKNRRKSILLPVVAGVWHGIAVHSKLYPIIYSLSYVIALSDVNKNKTKQSSTTHGVLETWVKALLGVAPLAFAISSATTFVGLTAWGVFLYGRQSLDDGLLYHFSRVDHRHNYSMHWYWIYLTRAAAAATRGGDSRHKLWHDDNNNDLWFPWVGRILLVPQAILLLYSSFALAPHDLSLALFVQTFCFVAQNKVITAQYFTWYLCLLPLCSHEFDISSRQSVALRRAIGLLVLSIVFWLGSAYCLEMQGWSVHRLVWVASVVFFVAQVNVLVQLLYSVKRQRRRANDAISQTSETVTSDTKKDS
ncbi:hypothetical protein ACA910_018626 [Epithemia clementina (nom. ined.)]